MKCPWVSLERARTVRSCGFRPEYELYSVLLFFLSLTGPRRTHTLIHFPVLRRCVFVTGDSCTVLPESQLCSGDRDGLWCWDCTFATVLGLLTA